jgi:hypothetical protein
MLMKTTTSKLEYIKMAAQSQRRKTKTATVRSNFNKEKKMSKNLAFIIIMVMFSIASAMQVRTKKWTSGTEFHFTFSESECKNMSESWGYASGKANDVISTLADGWEGTGGGLLIGRAAAVFKIACDLHNFSKEYVRDFGRPMSWTYTLQRRDGWRTPLKILDAIAGFWRKLAIGY